MRRALVVPLMICLVACSGGSATAAAGVTPFGQSTRVGTAGSASAEPAAAPAPTIVHTPEPESARSLVTVGMPDDVACKIAGAVSAPTALRFSASDAPYGRARLRRGGGGSWDLDDVIAFGWVDARAVEELLEGGGGRGEGIGLDRIGTMGGCCGHVFVCDHEVPIRVTLGEKSEIVGVSRRGVKLKTYGTSDGRHELFPYTFDSFEPAVGAKLFIDAERVAGCVDLEKRPN